MNDYSKLSDSEQRSKIVSIPPGARECLLLGMPISTRLRNVLAKLGCYKLGDLQGISYDVVLRKKDCGQQTINELESFIARLQSGKLPIPQTNRQQPLKNEYLDWEIDRLEFSVRAYNCLRWRVGIRTVRELAQKSEIELLQQKGFGLISLREVKDVLASMGLRLRVEGSQQQATGENNIWPLRIFIPQNARGWPLSKMPLSTRLAGILERKGFRLLGDLHGVTFEEVERTSNCGRRTKAELESFVLRLQSGKADDRQARREQSVPASLVRLIDEAVEKIPPRKREMLILRFGGKGNEPMALEGVGNRHNLTRERVRQILDDTLEYIHKLGWPTLDELLRTLSERCLNAVCPLTPQLLAQWLGPDVAACRYGLPFYIRLFNEIFPEFPGWPDGQKTILYNHNRCARQILLHLKEIIRGRMVPTPLAEAFDNLKEVDGLRELTAGELLSILRKEPSIKVEFTILDRPHIKQTSLNTYDLIWGILSQSDRPLTPEEITDKAVEAVGEDFSPPATFITEGILLFYDDVYLLDRRAYGLRRHFRLPASLWGKVKRDFHKLLKKENRPVSTYEVINESKFDWTALTNSHEVAEVLREDARFTDLGRFLFALSEWDVEEREHINDLVVKVLKQAGHPMPPFEIGIELNRFRSVRRSSVSLMVRANREVREYISSGFYGLKSWGEEVKEHLVSDPRLVLRILSRADRPLTFGETCQILEVPSEGPLAEKLWNTVRSLPKVKTRPEIKAAETLLIHRQRNLRRAIYIILAKANRMLSALEIHREVNAQFGPAFKDQSLSDIQKYLQQSRAFIRSKSGKYSLGGAWRRGKGHY